MKIISSLLYETVFKYPHKFCVRTGQYITFLQYITIHSNQNVYLYIEIIIINYHEDKTVCFFGITY